jgi:hypothetical protein
MPRRKDYEPFPFQSTPNKAGNFSDTCVMRVAQTKFRMGFRFGVMSKLILCKTKDLSKRNDFSNDHLIYTAIKRGATIAIGINIK